MLLPATQKLYYIRNNINSHINKKLICFSLTAFVTNLLSSCKWRNMDQIGQQNICCVTMQPIAAKHWNVMNAPMGSNLPCESKHQVMILQKMASNIHGGLLVKTSMWNV
jgi:hypothetical protein